MIKNPCCLKFDVYHTWQYHTKYILWKLWLWKGKSDVDLNFSQCHFLFHIQFSLKPEMHYARSVPLLYWYQIFFFFFQMKERLCKYIFKIYSINRIFFLCNHLRNRGILQCVTRIQVFDRKIIELMNWVTLSEENDFIWIEEFLKSLRHEIIFGWNIDYYSKFMT